MNRRLAATDQSLSAPMRADGEAEWQDMLVADGADQESMIVEASELESVILAREGDGAAAGGDFDDDSRQTDHLPVDATFEMIVSGDAHDEDEGEDAGNESRANILQRLDAIEEELRRIRALV